MHPVCQSVPSPMRGRRHLQWVLAQLFQSRRPIRWLHFPKCSSTLGISILSYACTDTIPSWHTVGMALRGGRIDVRMAHAIGARHKTRGSRCGGRLLLPLEGHRPVSPHDTGLVAMFRKPSQRLISAFLDNYHAYGLARRERAALKARAPTISHFVRYPGIAGCVTKMLAGSTARPTSRWRMTRCSVARCPCYARHALRSSALLRSGGRPYACCTGCCRVTRRRWWRNSATLVFRSTRIMASLGCRV